MSEQIRVPDPSTKCSHCGHYFRLLGDRDKTIRTLQGQLQAGRRACEELDLVQAALDQVGAPQIDSPHARLTTAGRLKQFLEAR